MPAYSFQSRFALPIIRGDKGGTIRAPRKPSFTSIKAVKRWHEVGGHAFPGETLALYTGMRTADCRLIAHRTCIATEPILLNFDADAVAFPAREYLIDQQPELDRFARFDGFSHWADLAGFWAAAHTPLRDAFAGWHIRWLPLPGSIDG